MGAFVNVNGGGSICPGKTFPTICLFISLLKSKLSDKTSPFKSSWLLCLFQEIFTGLRILVSSPVCLWPPRFLSLSCKKLSLSSHLRDESVKFELRHSWVSSHTVPCVGKALFKVQFFSYSRMHPHAGILSTSSCSGEMSLQFDTMLWEYFPSSFDYDKFGQTVPVLASI